MTVSRQLLLKDVIGSYVKVFQPARKMSGEGEEYSMQVVVPKGSPAEKQVKAAIAEICKEAFPKLKPASLKLGLRDADAEGKSDNDGNMKNMLFFNARRRADLGAPQVISRGKKFITSEDDFYSGCKCNVAVSAYSYDNSGSKGVGFGINAIQVMEQGDRWDGRVSALDVFDDLSDGEEESLGLDEPATVGEDDDFPWE